MSYGLFIKNGNGFSNLDPDSFTVKLVESVWVGWERIDFNTVVDVPTTTNVRAGMFHAVTIYEDPRPSQNPDLQDTFYPNIWPMCLPEVEVYNGFIRVKGSGLLNVYHTGMVVVSILDYV